LDDERRTKNCMRHLLAVALPLLLALSGVMLVLLRQSNPPRSSRPLLPAGAKAVSFTVTLRSTVTTDTGQVREYSPETLAVRSDGARVRLVHDGTGPVRQVSFDNGLVVEFKDAARGKSTVYRPIDSSWILDPSENCARNVFGEEPGWASAVRGAATIEAIAGYRAARFMTGPTTSWFAIDHGCALIRRFQSMPNGQVSRLEVMSLLPGEPDETLFELPESYREGAPSMFMPPPAEPCNERCQQNHRNYRASLDTNYFEDHVAESPTSTTQR
jgi:hypothetical protein